VFIKLKNPSDVRVFIVRWVFPEIVIVTLADMDGDNMAFSVIIPLIK
jgi:hypothetical protein